MTASGSGSQSGTRLGLYKIARLGEARVPMLDSGGRGGQGVGEDNVSYAEQYLAQQKLFCHTFILDLQIVHWGAR